MTLEEDTKESKKSKKSKRSKEPNKKSKTLESLEKEQSTQESEKNVTNAKKPSKSGRKTVTAEPISKRKDVSKEPSKMSKMENTAPQKPSQLGRSKAKSNPMTPKMQKKGKKPSAETDEMPPTANSEKSSEKEKKKNRQRKRSASFEKGKLTEEKPKRPADAPPKILKSAEPSVKPPAVTPTPDVIPQGKSSELAVNQTILDSEEKPPKKKKVLKRETNHVYHLRPGVNKDVEHARIQSFADELKMFETGQFTYLTDPTRYRFRSMPPMELVIQFVFPSLLILAIMLSTMAIVRFLTNDEIAVVVYNELNEMTLAKYDAYMIVDNIDEYIFNDTVLRELNCPGLVQGPYKPIEKHELQFLKFKNPMVKKAMKALTLRWMYQVDAVMNMNFECPPSVIIELEK